LIKFKSWLKKYLLTGLVVVVPITITIYIIQALIGVMDEFLSVLPKSLHPDIILGLHIPGLGLVLVTILVFLIGLLTRNYFGKKVVRLWDLMIGRIPIIRNIYLSIKQLTEAIFNDGGRHFKQVVMLEFPRPGLYSLGFVAGPAKGELEARAGEKILSIFIPCTPNPTTGYYVLVPEKDVMILEMSVEEGFKMVVSSGLVSPFNGQPG